MAMAGNSGSVYIGANKVAEIGTWKLDVDSDLIDVTSFDSGGWKESIQGLKSWSGSLEGNWNMSDTNGQKALQDALLGGTTVSLELRVNGTNKYSGTAFIGKMSVEAPVDGKSTVSFDFTGSGALTYA